MNASRETPKEGSAAPIGLAAPKNIVLKDLVAEIKRESSKCIKMQGEAYINFYLQSGYGAFSITTSTSVTFGMEAGICTPMALYSKVRRHHAPQTPTGVLQS